MRILGIDTTRKIARLFVYDDTKDQKELFIDVNENIKHSEGSFLYLEKILFDSKLKLNDFDYFSAVVGPGSFTGIRVGMSIIKGFKKCCKANIVPINTFEVLVNSIRNGVILLNSTATSCYFGKVKNKDIVETGIIEKNKINDMFKDEQIYILKEEQNMIALEYNNIVVIDEIWNNYIPTILHKIDNEKFDEFIPFYIQLSQAERNMNNE